MKKMIILLLISIFLLSGCMFENASHEINSIDYNLNIGKSYQENIIFTFPKNAYELAKENMNVDYDSLEYILLIDNFARPIHNNLYTLYGKKTYQKKNAIEVDLDFNYLEKDFVNSNYMNTCFENHTIKAEDDYLEIHLSGAFYCLQDKTMNLIVNSEYPNFTSNGIQDEHSAQWRIDSSNTNNLDIYYKVYRDKDNMATYYGALDKHLDHNSLAIIEILIIFAVLIGGFIFYKFLYNKEFNK